MTACRSLAGQCPETPALTASKREIAVTAAMQSRDLRVRELTRDQPDRGRIGCDASSRATVQALVPLPAAPPHPRDGRGDPSGSS